MPIPNKTIVVCLDIDDTLINFRTGRFNGGLRTWRNFLTTVRNACEDSGYTLLVQIITAKRDIDDLVNIVAYALRDFLFYYNYLGDKLDYRGELLADERSYYAMLHRYSKEDQSYQRTLSYVTPLYGRPAHQELLNVETILPSIHVTINSSKFEAMRYISNYFKNKIPYENMFLLDNNQNLTKELEYISKYRSLSFQFFSAYALEHFANRSKEIRTQVTSALLIQFAKTINYKINNYKSSVNQHLEVFSILADSNLKADNFNHEKGKSTDEIRELVQFGVFGRPVKKKLAAIEHFLDLTGFETYLEEAKTKFYRKIRKESQGQTRSQQSHAWLNLIRRLSSAKKSLYLSTNSMQDAKVRFLSECLAALQQADTALMSSFFQSGSRAYRFRLFMAKDNSYIKYRDKFHTEFQEHMQSHQIGYESNPSLNI